MYIQLQEHLNKQSILVEDQFGFRTDSTTKKGIYNLINEVLNAINNKFVTGVFLTLRMLLTLNHNILLSKLQFYGVNDKLLLEIRNDISLFTNLKLTRHAVCV
jgi:hypothetical protein